ncbi:MAG: Stk1 family PASTA domain-containing Ser/Thr kinase [Eubacteriales bacterium]|nr:Stk1 family PASTA domain-containing Ser/Thr kinase [Eubacteriales bacterium]
MKDILNGRYEIIEEVGSGGMALVYRAKCNVLNRFVAVKVLKQEFVNDQDFINKFKQESMSAARLNHKNIVNVYDTGVDDGIYYIVMEYLEGITLHELIQQKKGLSTDTAIDICIQICEALDHAHTNGIIHRDIKPHNILIDKNNQVKVADFGIARAVSNKTMTNSDNTLGSVNYFSPEQARGGYIDEKSDIYSLGIVLFEMLTGEVPFKGDSAITIALKHVNEQIPAPSTINKEIPDFLDEIVLKCTNKKQTLRYNSANAIISDLMKFKLNKEIFLAGSNNQSMDNEKTEALNRFLLETSTINSMDKTLLNASASKNNKVKADNGKVKAASNHNSNGAANSIPDDDDDLIEEDRSKLKYSILAIVAALALTLVLAFAAISFIKDYLSVAEVEVPDLSGVDEMTAQDTIENLGLEFIVKDRIYSSDFEEGQIMSQNIRAGEKLKEGFPIEVIVSLGERMINVPDLVHKYSNEALVLLNESGLQGGEITYEFSETVPWGLVIRQSPDPNVLVKEGEVVTYVLSKGQEVEYALMPSVVGETVTEAERILLSKGFSVGDISYRSSSDYAKDVVSYQSYPVGTEVEKGTAVSVIVSTGPEDVPDPTTQPGENGSPVSGRAQLTIELPDQEGMLSVAVERVLEDQRQIVYQQSHTKEDSPLKIILEGFGVQKFEVFINSEYYGAQEIDFGN